MEQQQPSQKYGKQPRRDFDRELDRLEAAIEQLRILYEQYFSEVIPQAPDKARKDVTKMIRLLMKAPFKNSATRFRMRSVVQRYQSYVTYWERVLKQREEGTYLKDVFKAEIREKLQTELGQENSLSNAAERGIRDLYNCYEVALKKAGKAPDNLNYESFKKSLLNKARQLKEQHGAKKLHYKVVIKDGKVVVKASAKS